jgi:hypothetical protein
MTRFMKPDLTVDPNSPFLRDASNKLVRSSYWMDMPGHALVMVMTKAIGANLTKDEKRAHLIDLKRERLTLKRSYRPRSSHAIRRDLFRLDNQRIFREIDYRATICGNLATKNLNSGRPLQFSAKFT